MTDTGPGAPSDATLMTAHLQGDPHALARLVERHRDRLWRVALNRLGEADQAEPALVEGLRAAAEQADGRSVDLPVALWLYRVVEEVCWRRWDRARFAAADPALGSGPANAALGSGPAAVRSAVARLPTPWGRVVMMVDVDGLSEEEAADVLNVTPGMVRAHCWRGRLALSGGRAVPEQGPGRVSGPG